MGLVLFCLFCMVFFPEHEGVKDFAPWPIRIHIILKERLGRCSGANNGQMLFKSPVITIDFSTTYRSHVVHSNH